MAPSILFVVLLLCICNAQLIPHIQVLYTLPSHAKIMSMDTATNTTTAILQNAANVGLVAYANKTIYFTSGSSIFYLQNDATYLLEQTNASAIHPINALVISGDSLYWCIHTRIFKKNLITFESAQIFDSHGWMAISSIAVSEAFNVLLYANDTTAYYAMELHSKEVLTIRQTCPVRDRPGNITGVGIRDAMFSFTCGTMLMIGQLKHILEPWPVCVDNCLTIAQWVQMVPYHESVIYLQSGMWFVAFNDIDHYIVDAQEKIGGFCVVE